jgi:hypothetical protein
MQAVNKINTWIKSGASDVTTVSIVSSMLYSRFSEIRSMLIADINLPYGPMNKLVVDEKIMSPLLTAMGEQSQMNGSLEITSHEQFKSLDVKRFVRFYKDQIKSFDQYDKINGQLITNYQRWLIIVETKIEKKIRQYKGYEGEWYASLDEVMNSLPAAITSVANQQEWALKPDYIVELMFPESEYTKWDGSINSWWNKGKKNYDLVISKNLLNKNDVFETVKQITISPAVVALFSDWMKLARGKLHQRANLVNDLMLAINKDNIAFNDLFLIRPTKKIDMNRKHRLEYDGIIQVPTTEVQVFNSKTVEVSTPNLSGEKRTVTSALRLPGGIAMFTTGAEEYNVYDVYSANPKITEEKGKIFNNKQHILDLSIPDSDFSQIVKEYFFGNTFVGYDKTGSIFLNDIVRAPISVNPLIGVIQLDTKTTINAQYDIQYRQLNFFWFKERRFEMVSNSASFTDLFESLLKSILSNKITEFVPRDSSETLDTLVDPINIVSAFSAIRWSILPIDTIEYTQIMSYIGRTVNESIYIKRKVYTHPSYNAMIGDACSHLVEQLKLNFSDVSVEDMLEQISGRKQNDHQNFQSIRLFITESLAPFNDDEAYLMMLILQKGALTSLERRGIKFDTKNIGFSRLTNKVLDNNISGIRDNVNKNQSNKENNNGEEGKA